MTSTSLHIFSWPGDMTLEVADYATGTVEKIVLDDDVFMGVKVPASSIGKVYEQFWEEKYGSKKERTYNDFGDALKWHKMIEEMYADYDAKQV